MIEWSGIIFLIFALAFVAFMFISWDKENPPK